MSNSTNFDKNSSSHNPEPNQNSQSMTDLSGKATDPRKPKMTQNQESKISQDLNSGSQSSGQQQKFATGQQQLIGVASKPRENISSSARPQIFSLLNESFNKVDLNQQDDKQVNRPVDQFPKSVNEGPSTETTLQNRQVKVFKAASVPIKPEIINQYQHVPNSKEVLFTNSVNLTQQQRMLANSTQEDQIRGGQVSTRIETPQSLQSTEQALRDEVSCISQQVLPQASPLMQVKKLISRQLEQVSTPIEANALVINGLKDFIYQDKLMDPQSQQFQQSLFEIPQRSQSLNFKTEDFLRQQQLQVEPTDFPSSNIKPNTSFFSMSECDMNLPPPALDMSKSYDKSKSLFALNQQQQMFNSLSPRRNKSEIKFTRDPRALPPISKTQMDFAPEQETNKVTQSKRQFKRRRKELLRLQKETQLAELDAIAEAQKAQEKSSEEVCSDKNSKHQIEQNDNLTQKVDHQLDEPLVDVQMSKNNRRKQRARNHQHKKKNQMRKKNVNRPDQNQATQKVCLDENKKQDLKKPKIQQQPSSEDKNDDQTRQKRRRPRHRKRKHQQRDQSNVSMQDQQNQQRASIHQVVEDQPTGQAKHNKKDFQSFDKIVKPASQFKFNELDRISEISKDECQTFQNPRQINHTCYNNVERVDGLLMAMESNKFTKSKNRRRRTRRTRAESLISLQETPPFGEDYDSYLPSDSQVI